jgi:glycosyltransferase involved in cell wall biosynthesis
MRVLLCLTSLDLTQGGIAAVSRNLVRGLPALDRAGQPVDVRALVYHGHEPQLAPEYWQKPGSFLAEGCGSSRRRFVTRFLSLCVSWRPSLVLVGHIHLAVVPYLFHWLLPGGYVLFCYGTEFDDHLSPLRRAAFRAARLRLGISRFTTARLTDLFPGAAIETCELATDELAIIPTAGTARRELSLPDAFGDPQPLGERTALIVGRVAASERYKGHDQLITVLPRVRERVPAAQLVVVGAGDDLERLKAKAREAGVGQAVLFTGFASPELLTELFARCRLFAMPSRGEGFGLVYLEAMHHAKPCLASTADAGGEVVADGVTGLVVDPLDLGQITEALLRLMTDDELAGRLGRAGLERLNQRYRFHHFRRRLGQCLGQVVPELFPAEEELAASVGP